jgi:hypothetical protein
VIRIAIAMSLEQVTQRIVGLNPEQTARWRFRAKRHLFGVKLILL